MTADFFISYATTILEFLCIYTTAHLFLGKNLIPSTVEIPSALFLIILLGTIPDKYSAILWIVGQLVYIIYVITISSKSFFHSMLLYVLTTCAVLFSQFFMVLIISFSGISNNFIAGIIGSIGSLVIILLLFRFTPLTSLYEIVLKSSKFLQMFLLNTYLIFFSVLLIFKSNNAKIYENPTMLFTIFVLIISINASILYYDLRIQNQENQLLSYQKNIPIYESLISDIRSNQHEYSNRLQSLSTLPAICKDYDSLCQALSKHTKDYSHSLHAYSLLQTNMPLLSASLYNLMNRAAKNDITVHFDVVSSTIKSSAPEYILSDLSCILLQNAIEESNPGDFIYVHIESKDGLLHFEVRNPSSINYSKDDLLSFFGKGYSTKFSGQNQGLGLYYLKNMIDKYDGMVGCECIEYNDEIWVVFKIII
jgi:hypothetical protein